MDTVSPHALNGNPSPLVPARPGIYKITCTVTKKIYVGSAVILSARRHDHYRFLQQNKHHNQYLQNAWNKYSEGAFTFEVLELILVPEMLTAREQYWFNKLSPFGKKGYNIAPTAGSCLGRTHAPETREKLRQAKLGKKLSPEHAEKSRKANIGRKRSPEFIAKQKARIRTPETLAKLRGRKWTPEQHEKLRIARNTPEARERNRQAHLGKSPSLETREKLREANSGKKMSPEAIKKSWDVRRARQKERLSQNSPEDMQH